MKNIKDDLFKNFYLYRFIHTNIKYMIKLILYCG